ncbi:MAG TPA: hypothetical protein VG603_11785 [Chitinophagales bacterium]|nr:hypothetical protein [Chitinophagales bacterium]
MLLQYPKLSESVNVALYDDYIELYRQFIIAYRKLHNDVAAFSLLPERFINEAEPVIDKFLSSFSRTGKSEAADEKLKTITDFISRFYNFTDRTTEMFMEHEALAGRTVSFIKKSAAIKADTTALGPGGLKYYDAIPELENLQKEIAHVQMLADDASEDLKSLAPLWQKISESLHN